MLKPEEDWNVADELSTQGNSRALNSIFNGVDKNVFKMIKNYKHTKGSGETLRKVREGNPKVKMEKHQLHSIKFENLKKKEVESI